MLKGFVVFETLRLTIWRDQEQALATPNQLG